MIAKESYADFLNRINAFEKPETSFDAEHFSINPSVSQKVNSDNSFRPFYGDTIVFDLDAAARRAINNIIDKLYQAAPECFCERLRENTLHMTLHDLTNSVSEEDIAEKLSINKSKVSGIMSKITPGERIAMKSKYVFNMVGTSLVLGLYPADENAYHRLMELYELFDSVVELSYPLTPHITLAYYNVNGFGEVSAARLQEVVKEINFHSMDIELDTGMLRYQRFRSMNDYTDVLYPGI